MWCPPSGHIIKIYRLTEKEKDSAGHEIIFAYIAFNGRLRLAQIKDAQQSLIEIKWPPLHQVDGQPPSLNHIIITVWPGLPQSYSLFLQIEQGKLTRVSKYDKDNVDTARCHAGALCEIRYDSQERLASLRLPGGINEDFVYDADGAVRPLPCIESHTLSSPITRGCYINRRRHFSLSMWIFSPQTPSQPPRYAPAG